jgi:hypothetical protein
LCYQHVCLRVLYETWISLKYVSYVIVRNTNGYLVFHPGQILYATFIILIAGLTHLLNKIWDLSDSPILHMFTLRYMGWGRAIAQAVSIYLYLYKKPKFQNHDNLDLQICMSLDSCSSLSLTDNRKWNF